jgi:DNA-directed RNA polymerase specialized sigma24 family protein
MTGASNLRLLEVDRLADECAEQTARFFSRRPYNPAYCYELFRRALVSSNDYAWEKIYRIYRPLVAGWVRCHSGLPAAGEDVEYFVNGAFDRFWSAVDGEKFRQFQDLARLLHYFRMCVNSIIIDHARNNQIRTVDLEVLADLPPGDSTSVEALVTDKLERHRLWKTAIALTRDEKEYVVLEYSFVYGLKPSQIYMDNSDRFESLDELYRVKRNLLNRLSRNPAFQQFLGRH